MFSWFSRLLRRQAGCSPRAALLSRPTEPSFLPGKYPRSLALEHRRSLLKKRLDALFEVVAKKRGSPRCLNGFELVGAHGGAPAQAGQLGLDDRNRQRRAAGDRR